MFSNLELIRGQITWGTYHLICDFLDEISKHITIKKFKSSEFDINHPYAILTYSFYMTSNKVSDEYINKYIFPILAKYQNYILIDLISYNDAEDKTTLNMRITRKTNPKTFLDDHRFKIDFMLGIIERYFVLCVFLMTIILMFLFLRKLIKNFNGLFCNIIAIIYCLLYGVFMVYFIRYEKKRKNIIYFFMNVVNFFSN